MKKFLPKLFSTLMILSLLFTCIPNNAFASESNYSAEELLYIQQMAALQEAEAKLEAERLAARKYQEEVTIPNVKMVSSAYFNVSGEKATINVDLKNTTAYTAYDLFIQTSFENNSSVPFVVNFENNIKSLSGSKTLPLELVIDPTAKSGVYALNLSYNYNNEYSKNFTGTDTIYVKVDNTNSLPNIIVSQISSSASVINPGQSFNLNASLQNLGSQTAYDVQVLLDGLSADTISLKNNTNSLYFSEMNSNELKELSFNLSTYSKAKQGNYPLTLTVKYNDKSDNSYTETKQYFVSVGSSGTEKEAYLQIENMVTPTKDCPVSESFKVSFDIKNSGNTQAKNIKVTANYGSDGAIIPKSSTTKLISSLAEGAKTNVVFDFMPTSSAKSQNYTLSFSIEYSYSDIAESTVNESCIQYTGVNIYNPEDTSSKTTSIPKIIISKYSSDPIVVNAGEEFLLNLSFTNTHATKTVKNIKIYLTVSEKSETGNIFIPVDSSNTFFVDSISPKGTVDRSVKLFAIADAKPKTYDLIVNFDYEDETGTLPVASEYIGINVRQPAKFETSEITIEPEGTVGASIPVYFDFYNTGNVTIRNLMIKLKGDFTASPSSNYYGNLDSGNYDYFDGTITPTAAGKQVGQLIISYDDANGEHIEKITEIEVNVAEGFTDAFMPGGDMMGGDMIGGDMMGNTMTEAKTSSFPWAIVIVIVVVVIVVAVIVVLKLRKKHKKGLDIDE